MRELNIKKDPNKKNRTGQILKILIGMFLIIVMTLSIADIALNSSSKNSDKLKYKDIDFIKKDSYWQFNFQGYSFVTSYNPEETKDISFFSYSSLQNYIEKPLYFVGNSADPSFEITRNLVGRFVTRASEACINEKECDGDFPLKNCTKDNIIVFENPEKDEKEKMYQENSCVYIIANYENQTRYADKFLYTALGI